MLIPRNKKDLADFATDLVRRCMQTQQERAQQYDLWRKFYLFGADMGMSDYNKTQAHIDQLASFIFAPGGLKFTVDIPDGAGPAYAMMSQMAERASRKMNEDWHSDSCDTATGMTVTASLINGVQIEKQIWQRTPKGMAVVGHPVDPENFGVLNEQAPALDAQEAMCHEFYYTADALWRELRVLPNAREIWEGLSFIPAVEAKPPMSTLQAIITASQASGSNISGKAVPDLRMPAGMFKPVIVEDVVPAHELWVWDDEADDYRCLTLLDPDIVLYDRRENPCVPRDRKILQQEPAHPFVRFCARPWSTYFWGMSEVFPLMGLQAWSDEDITTLRKASRLRMKPPTALSGFNGVSDEKLAAMWDPASYIQSDIPNAKVDRLTPDLPVEEMYKNLQEVDGMFADMSGMKSILRGEGVQGMRSEGQAALMAKFAGARVNQKSLNIEQGLIDSANLKFQLLRLHDATRLSTKDGTMFTLGQIVPEACVKVDSHSHSPIFAEAMMEEATAAVKLGAITPEDWLEMSHLPGKDRLMLKARERAKQHQQMVAEAMKNPRVAEAVQKKQAMRK